MKRFATGVTLITFKHQDSFGGLTVSSFCSLSMNPPLILICIDKKIDQDYQYGFVTDIEQDTLPPGLSEDVIRFISKKKNDTITLS